MQQDPAERLDYTFDWQGGSKPFLSDGETITGSDWTVTPDDITDSAPAATDTTTTIWLTGGTLDKRYRITNHVVTSAGREGERSFVLDIRDR